MRIRILATSLAMALAIGMLMGGSGCGKKKSDGTLAMNVGASLTDAECQQFADNLQRVVKAGNTDAFSASLDMDAMSETAFADLDVEGKFKQDFAAGIRSSLAQPTGLSQQVISGVAQGGSFKLLRILTDNNQKRVRFRMFHEKQGVNYMDFLLSRRKSGEIKATDIHIFASGELLSATMRRLILPMIAAQNRGLLARLRGQDNAYLQSMTSIQKMAQAIAQGQHKSALTLYSTLPDTMQKEKMVLLLRMRAAFAVGDAEYTQAMEDFRKYHANDPAADLTSIDYYIMRKQPEKALEMVDRLDKAVGGDAMLNVFRVGILLTKPNSPEKKTLTEARKLMEETVRALPEEIMALEILAGLCLAEQRFEPIPELLDKIQAQGGSLAAFQQNPSYAGFVQSPAYRKWKGKTQ